MNSHTTLELRREPSQARSKATFKHILSSAAELLEEVGFDGFTTNLLSDRSGVGIRAIYRYFPNKYALVNELASMMASEWRIDLERDSNLEYPDSDWREIWCGYLDVFVQSVHQTRGGIAVLQAMRAHPELRAVDDAANDAYIKAVASALVQRKPSIKKADAFALATTLLKSTVAIVDASLEESKPSSARLLEMLKIMHLALLSKYLDA